MIPLVWSPSPEDLSTYWVLVAKNWGRGCRREYVHLLGWPLQYATSEGLAALRGGLDRFGAAYASVVQAARPLITRFCFSEETSIFLCGSWSWGVDKCVLPRCWRVAL